MNTSGLRFLRPYLCKDVAVSSKSAYVRFFNTTRRLMEDKLGDGSEYPVELMVPFQVRERVKELKKANSLEWPRIARDLNATSLRKFKEEFGHILPGDRLNDVSRTLQGRVRNVRKAGKGLVFIDIDQDRYYTQLVLNHISMEAFSGTSKKNFADLTKVIKRGDIISCTGTPFSNKSGQLCLAALDICTLLSPSLESLPFTIKDREMRIRNRHVDFLTNSTASNTIKARSKIIQNIRDFLLKDDFLEVQTPILADKAGGAVAKPFGTQATEFPEKQLALRIAPELWLKRLIIGGMDRVFEIGPSFRNEGLDGTHNPEFTTCEFYKSFAELEELIQMTENLFAGLSKLMIDLKGSSYKTLPELDATLFVGPFKRISFIPAIEEGLKQKLPDLSSATAEEDLVTLFQAHDIPLPASPTLPRLLDKLSSIYIEPKCVAPTFITYHPACMAPLSKSFFDEATKQYVSARAELFIEKKEIANMYEEENSPFAQRKKFMEQIKWRDDENSAVVDESYLEALEWGMPPTGGWGMGVDRLIMLLTGATRISDVLAFGSLRNVVNLGSIGSEKLKPSKEATKNIFEEMGGE